MWTLAFRTKQGARTMLDHRFTFPELSFTDQRASRTIAVKHGPKVRVVVVPARGTPPRPAKRR
jgi:hypothetical protein